MINFDEIHHSNSTKCNKGGPQANTITNLNLPWVGTRVFKDPGRHVTGVYVSTPLEAMPPIMIFETKSKVKENMRIKPSWVKDMPKVVTTQGFEEPT